MIRGETKSFKFKLPRNFEEFKCIEVTFWQNENNGPSLVRPLPIIKVKEQCVECASSNQFRVKLTAEETLRFSDERKAYVQCRGLSVDGLTYISKEQEITVYPSRHNDVLEEDIIPSITLDGFVVLDGDNIESYEADDVIILNSRNVES